jgi:hypothetical protein
MTSQNSWLLWAVPVLGWCVYSCWVSGYSAGYEQGQSEAWVTAREALGSPTAFTTVRLDDNHSGLRQNN